MSSAVRHCVHLTCYVVLHILAAASHAVYNVPASFAFVAAKFGRNSNRQLAVLKSSQ